MRKIYDISLPISPDLVIWPNNPPFSLKVVERPGDAPRISELRLGTHTGTHVDAPGHVLPGGSMVESLDLEILVGSAVVLDLMHVADVIRPQDLATAELPAGAVRVLLKTRNSSRWKEKPQTFDSHYVCLSPEGAHWLLDRGIKLVGIDFLSIEQFHKPGRPTHHTLLSAGAVIIEGLNLADVVPGPYTLSCLPLNIVGAEGSPARVILIRD